jgi:MYXO-CTERM domain-containing protein
VPPIPPDDKPTPADDVPVTPVATVGVCQVKILTCTSKADCPANLDCVKSGVEVYPTCAPNTTCDLPERTATPTGTCKAVCNVDSDCPAPLVCKLQGQTCMGGGVVSSDGTVTNMTETCSGGQKLCSYEPVVCSTAQACAPDYQCAKVSEYQSCTGSAPADCPRSKDGTDVACTPTTPEPPVCTSTVVNNCLPKQINCDAGQSCPAGWSCFDFTYFDNGSVPGWSTPMPSKACLPDGLILTVRGQASGGATTTYQGENPTRGGSNSGGSGAIDLGKGGAGGGPVTNTGESTPPNVAPAAPTDDQGHAAAGDAGTETAKTTVRGGGCAVGGAQGSSFGLLSLALAGMVLRLIRRRK